MTTIRCRCSPPGCQIRAYLEKWEDGKTALIIIGDPNERKIILDLGAIRELIADLRDAEMTLMLEEQTRRQE